ncbi:MAG: aldo/keto reductase [Ignavibacteriales bacterium]|nr:aldo/keto reductase [Ignavibacteriales bacterium]
MNRRKLGKNGPELTEIGFGAWAIGGPWQFGWGKIDDNESINAIHRAIDLGINWIDTAAIYGLGHSEEVVGKALQDKRQNVFLATKCGMVWDDQRNVKIHASSKSIISEIEKSLNRLNVDYVDLYQIHWPDPKTEVEESWETLVKLKEEGKTRFIGVCNYDLQLLQRCNKISQVQSLQPPYSLLRRQIEKEILPYCLRENIGVIAYSPMQAGILSGKFDITKLADDDWRRSNKFYLEPNLSRALEFVEKIKPIASKYNKTVGQLAIAWVLKHTAVTSAIVGARTATQVVENVEAAGFTISSDDIVTVEDALNTKNDKD